MGSFVSLVAGALGGIWGYVAAAAIAAILAASTAGYAVHKMDEGAINAMKLADALEAVKAEKSYAAAQKSEDNVNLAAALAEAEAQQKIVTQTVTVTKEVPIHVPDTSHCNNGPSFGLVRLLNTAAGIGPGPDTIPATARESDDACAPVSWRDFATAIAGDYGAGRANAEQLNALEADVRALAAVNARPANEGDGK